MLDIGGGSTTVSVFDDDGLVATSVIPLGGYNITKDLSIGLRTTSDEAEDIKLNHGHAFYNDANEEETFDVNIIGSNQKQFHNQLDLAEIIEARLEEILLYSAREIQKMGYEEIPGGLVLTGGTMSMPGSVELAQDIFQSNVRIAIPDYIGVREPQYTAGIGILKFAYKNARIQGKELTNAVKIQQSNTSHTNSEKPVRTKKTTTKQKETEKKEPKIANFFKYFFD
ncbi:cell division protein FtsA [Gracilibacillus boraciitolerans JCM 21714]|uniref:Cell division protein FtsA n=1 Tax=Gracilibacillus boraciitolerans JCM 21714 TaxID=1298598 RepID=W4VFY2_9BACI|nr:cell division protein FtsA [Gracilibacillus boraciitolerans JCM 21714]